MLSRITFPYKWITAKNVFTSLIVSLLCTQPQVMVWHSQLDTGASPPKGLLWAGESWRGSSKINSWPLKLQLMTSWSYFWVGLCVCVCVRVCVCNLIQSIVNVQTGRDAPFTLITILWYFLLAWTKSAVSSNDPSCGTRNPRTSCISLFHWAEMWNGRREEVIKKVNSNNKPCLCFVRIKMTESNLT